MVLFTLVNPLFHNIFMSPQHHNIMGNYDMETDVTGCNRPRPTLLLQRNKQRT